MTLENTLQAVNLGKEKQLIPVGRLVIQYHVRVISCMPSSIAHAV